MPGANAIASHDFKTISLCAISIFRIRWKAHAIANSELSERISFSLSNPEMHIFHTCIVFLLLLYAIVLT